MSLDTWSIIRSKFLGYTLLGEQRSWRERLATHKIKIALVAVVVIIGLLGFSHIAPTDERRRHKGPYVEYSLGKYWQGWTKTERLLVFGDSYSTTFFDTQGPVPSVESPIGTPPWPGETVGNGPNYVGYLTFKLNESVILTADFAIGGATVADMVHKDWRSMRSQINDRFMAFNQNHTGFWESQSSLFFIWIGINDVHEAFNTTDSFPPTLEMYTGLVEKLYDSGARNFMFINVPPLSRSPYAAAAGLQDIWRSMVHEWNSAIESIAWSFANRHKDVSIFFFDGWTLFNDIMNDPCVVPESCAFEVLEDYCPMYALGNIDWNTYKPECPYSADKYFWIDPLHPTTITQNATANAIHKALLASSNQ